MLKSFFKKVLWIIAIFVVLDIGAMLVLPHVLPKERIAALVKEQVKDATGRELAFSDVSFVFWPNIGIELKDATFSNPAWAKDKHMITLGKAEVALAVMPILEHHIVVKKFVLNEPVINLEVGGDGRASWEFASETPAGAAASAPAAPRKSLDKPAAGGYDLQLGRIQISKGRLVYTDGQKKTATRLDDVDLNINLPDLAGALQLDGGLTYRGQRIKLSLGLDKPSDLMSGKASQGQLTVTADDFTARADGTFATQGTLMKGALDLTVSSLPKLVAWAQGAKEQKLPFEKMSFAGNAHVSASEIILKNATLKLDDIEAKGDVNAGFANKPEIFARLSVGKLNLDRFTGEDPSAGGAAAGAAKKPDAQGWDTTPLDFSGLKAVNADLKLDTKGFTLRGVDVGPSTLAVTVQNGALSFKSSEATLFGGTFSSDLSLNANTSAIAFNVAVKGVQAKPVLETFARFKKLSGTAEGHVALTAAGNSQQAIIASLGGSGSLVFKNGSLEGIDLVKIAKLIQSRLSNMGVGEGKTDFVEMGGTFTIARGIASNSDLKLKGPLLQATGKGSVDLPRKYVNYRATPVLTASSDVENAQGLAVPVDITGPFSSIKVVPDFLSVAKNIAENPEQIKATAKNVRDNIRDIRKNIKKDPASAIQGILNGGGIGGLLGGGSQQPAPATDAPAPAAAPAPTDTTTAPAEGTAPPRPATDTTTAPLEAAPDAAPASP